MRAEAADADRLVDLLVRAFLDDPTWSWACPDPAARPHQLTWLWRLAVDGAMRFGSVTVAEEYTAAAVWIPPGGTEFSDEQAARFGTELPLVMGQDAWRTSELFERFEVAHPREEPHYYLSILGTDLDLRGHGYGLALLAADLVRIDAAGAPAYLEASNSANVALYARSGFEPLASIDLPDGGPTITTMWRTARRGTSPTS
jgi:GNAT superfamily N-acetyltransferase